MKKIFKSLPLAGRPAALLLILSAGGVSSAYALNGNVCVNECAACNTIDDFVSVGISRARGRAESGTYAVSSHSSPRSALVKVTGTRFWVCDSQGENCVPELHNATGYAIDFDGTPLTSDAQLDVIDEGMFASKRSRVIMLPANRDYSGSIINSLDEEVQGAIGQALALQGIMPNTLPVGTIVLVVFADGTKATFKKISNTLSVQWKWTGKAWDSQGRPINRDGSLQPNANTSGAGGGAGSLWPTTPTGSDIRYDIGFSGRCTSTTTIRIGGEVVSSIIVFHPC